MKYIVNVFHDKESDHWCAESDDVQGLVMGSGSLDRLIERTNMAIADLLQIKQFEVEYRITHTESILYG